MDGFIMSSQIDFKFQTIRIVLWFIFIGAGVYFIANEMLWEIITLAFIILMSVWYEIERQAVERYYGKDWHSMKNWFEGLKAYWRSDDGKKSNF